MDAPWQVQQHDVTKVDRAWMTAVIASGATIIITAWMQHFGEVLSGPLFYLDSALVLTAGSVLAYTRSRVAAIFLLFNITAGTLSLAWRGAWFVAAACLPFGVVYLHGFLASVRLHRLGHQEQSAPP